MLQDGASPWGVGNIIAHYYNANQDIAKLFTWLDMSQRSISVHLTYMLATVYVKSSGHAARHYFAVPGISKVRWIARPENNVITNVHPFDNNRVLAVELNMRQDARRLFPDGTSEWWRFEENVVAEARQCKRKRGRS